MKILKSVLAGIVSLGLFAGVVSAQSVTAVKQYEYSTNYTRNSEMIWYGTYTQSATGNEHFLGSTTTHGGTTTFKSGCVDVAHINDTIEIAIQAIPNGVDGGSATVNFYGIYGTTTADNTVATTKGCVMLRPILSLNVPSSQGAAGTTTVVSLTNKPTLIALGVDVTAGTVTWNINANSRTER
jgi:hypothetical protein